MGMAVEEVWTVVVYKNSKLRQETQQVRKSVDVNVVIVIVIVIIHLIPTVVVLPAVVLHRSPHLCFCYNVPDYFG
ncbi:hypothetical protein M5D96_006116 [Drosophila gunungcola]|uniref:Uncharacterized protein n=1 Tax=Drosophila gunungcola TaxID=103775 RepID=A0A9P9YRQ7_9MUSC|nr:hypothetical protein M5D96_006116 [Drosophila gunungcola]